MHNLSYYTLKCMGTLTSPNVILLDLGFRLVSD